MQIAINRAKWRKKPTREGESDLSRFVTIYRTDAILRIRALPVAWDFVPRIRLAREGIHQWSGQHGKITVTHGVRRHKRETAE